MFLRFQEKKEQQIFLAAVHRREGETLVKLGPQEMNDCIPLLLCHRCVIAVLVGKCLLV